MDSSSSDWIWYPDRGLYYSSQSQAYARPNPYAPTGWEYIPLSTGGQPTPQQQQQVTSTDEGGRVTVDYSNLQQSPIKETSDEQEREGEEGGIGNVGWGLDFVLPGEEPQAQSAKTTEKDASLKPEASTSALLDLKPSPNDASERANIVKPTPSIVKHATTLRLVKLASLSTSSPLSTSESLAVLDARPSGYILGRDKHLARPVLRLKELAVSKIHATVWFGWRGKDMGELLRSDIKDELELVDEKEGRSGGLGESAGERRFWIADCGSTHGTFLRSGSASEEVPHSAPKELEEGDRLSPARKPSAPVPLSHLDKVTIGSTTFECHLHPEWPCEKCAMTDPSLIIPLAEPEDGKTSTTYASAGTTGASIGSGMGGIPTVPGNWKETEERRIALTAEAKRADTHRRSALAMKKLRESYFGGGASAGGGAGDADTGGDGEKATGGKRKWGNKADKPRESDEGWKKKRMADTS